MAYVCETNQDKKMQKVGFLGISNQLKEVLGAVIDNPGFEVSGIYIPEVADSVQENKYKQLPYFNNPFGLIAESDLLIVNKTDEYSYNLIIECIQNSRNILIGHPENLTIEEIDYLNKLAIEASVYACPLISYKFNYLIKESEIIPCNPKMLRLKSKGKNKLINNLSNNQLSLFIADLVISLIHSQIKKINCHSIKITEENYPLTNLSVQFDNGCIANVEVDTVAETESLLLELYYHNRIIEVDLLAYTLKHIVIEKDNRILTTEKIFHNKAFSFQQMIDFVNAKDNRGISHNHLADFKSTLMVYNKLKEKLVRCN